MNRFKIVMTAGAIPYDDMHSASKRGALPMLFPEVQINCGTTRVKRHQVLGTAPYTADDGLGWLDGTVEVVRGGLGKSVYRDAVRGKGAARLRVDARDGLYLVNALFGSGGEAGGPASISAGGTRHLAGITTAAGEFSAKTFATRAREGRLELTLDGPSWALAGLSLSPLAYDSEDYLIGRSWWLHQRHFEHRFAQVEPIPDLPAIVETSRGVGGFLYLGGVSCGRISSHVRCPQGTRPPSGAASPTTSASMPI